MSSTSQKHRDFVGEPMGEKPVKALTGIGDVLGGKLADKGFDKFHAVWDFSDLAIKLTPPAKGLSWSMTLPPCWLYEAYIVLGQFLVLKKDIELFTDWLKDICGANAKQARDCSS